MVAALLSGAPAIGVAQGTSLACGIPPIPPVGCRVGQCVCDASGNNCHYQMLC
jgi:hypothetical protein